MADLSALKGDAGLFEKIKAANPGVEINKQYLDAVYRYAEGRDASEKEFNRFKGYNVASTVGTILGSQTPFSGGSLVPMLTDAARSEANSQINAQQTQDFASQAKSVDVQTRDRVSDLFDFIGFDPKEFAANQPKPPSMAELFKTTRQEYGVTDLENNLAQLKAEEQDIRARMRDRQDYEAGKPVALGVISGKQTEIERQESRILDDNIRAQALVTDQLNVKYTMINTIMTLTQTDYQNSVEYYDRQYARALDMVELVRGVRKDVLDEQTALQDSARANLQVIFNGIEGGTLKLEDMSEESKALISKLELQAGLPVGITRNLKSAQPEKEIVSSTTRQESNGDKYADVIMRDRDGRVSIEHLYLGKERLPATSTPTPEKLTESEYLREATSRVSSKLSAVTGGDGYVSPDDYREARRAWISTGLTGAAFDDAFASFANPSHIEHYDLIANRGEE